MSISPILAASHLWDSSSPLHSPITRGVLLLTLIALLFTPLILLLNKKLNKLTARTVEAIRERYRTWLFLAPLLLIPILYSPGSAIIAVTIFSLICYREFARATGLFRWRDLSALVALAIILINFAAFDSWYNLFLALPPLCIVVFAAYSVLPDEPRGYLQRVGLASFAFLFIGVGLAHLSYLANSTEYRPFFCIILLCTQISDLLSFASAKLFNTRPIFRQTTARKTVSGMLVPFFIIAFLSAYLIHIQFRDTPIDTVWKLATFGIAIAACAQLGDLVIASIKRDIGIKDMAGTLPGHGGFLDRFNSVLLVAPVVFHLLKYFDGLSLNFAQRIFTGQ